ncbi:MAG: hypothetical protein IPL87_02785 [Candidatus Moraniibacteriota bacterium]|nr:MAG: hypothetical protein IPL87_02785 [Candidatus Moranbacteria bacterium]
MKQFLIVIVLLLAGCAVAPPAEILGLERARGRESNIADSDVDVDFEPPAAVVTFIALPPPEQVVGFEFPVPPEIGVPGYYKKIFDSFVSDEQILVVRRAAHVIVKGGGESRILSVYIRGGKAYVLARAVEEVIFLSPRGKRYPISQKEMRKLSPEEIRGIYLAIFTDFSKESLPIEGSGVRLYVQKDAREVLKIPSLITTEERRKYCGFYSISTGEIASVVTANPYGLLPKMSALVCSALTKPNLLEGEERSPNDFVAAEGFALQGDK